jgi:hypothetical protein
MKFDAYRIGAYKHCQHAYSVCWNPCNYIQVPEIAI